MNAHRPPFCRLPLHILEEIAVAVAVDGSPGLPRDIVALLQTCKQVYSQLSYRFNNYLFARIFFAMFDTRPIRRRFGDEAMHSGNLAKQLRAYCLTLKRIRNGDFTATTICEDLWAAFFMLMENDGRNYAQLEWAGLSLFVDGFVRQRLWTDREHNWPEESSDNALALFLMWYTSDYDMLAQESPEARREVMEVIRPYVVNPVRYAPFHAPDNHFVLPVPRNFQQPYTHRTPQGLYPPYRCADEFMMEHEHFGQRLRILQPSASLFAKLIYFARLEAIRFPLPTNLPEDRAAADALGIHEPRPTREDFQVFNEHKGSPLVPKNPWDWFQKLSVEELQQENNATWTSSLRSLSSQFDLDWNRMCFCHNPRVDPREKGVVYSPGSITGQWLGRLLHPANGEYFEMMGSLTPALHKPMMTTLPISFRLREHHCISPNEPVAHGGQRQRPMLDDGIANAWFPVDSDFVESGNMVKVIPQNRRRYKYETYKEGTANSHDESRCTACLARLEIEREELIERMRFLNSDPLDFSSGPQEVAEARAVAQEAMGDDVSVDDVLSVEMERAEAEASVESSSSNSNSNVQAPPCNGIRDIIITGESLPKHSLAWHRFKIYGRVRRWDGLIALVRIPVDSPELGITIFRGYIVANQNFVGNWRAWTNLGSLPLEGPFVASRAPNAE